MKSQARYLSNLIHYNVVLRTLGRGRRWDELRLCWIEMAKDGIMPTNNSYATLIDVYGKAGLVKEALLWLRHMKSRGVSPDEVTMNTVLRILKDSGQFDKGERLFKGWCDGRVELEFLELDNFELDLVNPEQFFLSELFKSGVRAPISRIALGTEERPQKPRFIATYNTLIDMYGKAGRLKDASDAFATMLRSGVAPDTITFDLLVLHGRDARCCNSLLGAEFTLDSIAYNVAIHAYGTSGEVNKVLNLFMRMQDEGLNPDLVTYIYLAGCYGKAEMIKGLKMIYGLLKYEEIEPNESLYKAIAEAYRVAGKHDLAELVDQEMKFSFHTTEYVESETEDD